MTQATTPRIQASAQDLSAKAADARRNSAWRSPWVMGWITLVVVVLAVNATMIFLAFATNPGLVVDDYYERGRNVERTIATRRADAPGWTTSVDTPEVLVENRTVTIRFFVVDRAGQPVSPDSVTYYAYRPSDASADFSLPMTAESPGRYAVDVTFPMSGIWDTLVAAQADGHEVVFDQRVNVGEP